VDAVEELAYRDDADRAIFLTEERLDLTTAFLEFDQQIGIDQDGHGSPGAPALSRISRRSSANASSGLGALASRSRKRDAETNRDLGGPISATGTPPRVNSISSPVATRFSTSEKLRAAPVAVMRDTPTAYLINRIPGCAW
jgi:prevent-host-death family protein